jgi:hypothetical protein
MNKTESYFRQLDQKTGDSSNQPVPTAEIL